MAEITKEEWTAHLGSVTRRMNRLTRSIFPEAYRWKFCEDKPVHFRTTRGPQYCIDVSLRFSIPFGTGQIGYRFPHGHDNWRWDDTCQWSIEARCVQEYMKDGRDVIDLAAASCAASAELHGMFTRVPGLIGRIAPVFGEDTVSWLLGFSELESIEAELLPRRVEAPRPRRGGVATP